MGTLQITTLKGTFTIDPDQLVGVERIQVQTPDGVVDGTRILIHIGVIARPPHEVMAVLAKELEKANGRIVPASRVVLPRGEG